MLNLSHYRLRNAYVQFAEVLGMCYETDMRKAYKFFQALSSLSEVIPILAFADIGNRIFITTP